MMNRPTITKFLLLPVIATFLVTWNGLAQSSESISKPIGKPIGELLVNSTDGAVTVNGVGARWGSTIFDGSEIKTNGGPAFVSFSGGLGAISIGPGSKARFAIKDSRVLAELTQGSLTVRSKVASQVAAPDRTVLSEQGNLYNVIVSPSAGTLVESLGGPLVVSMANGAFQNVVARIQGAVPQVAVEKPSPDGAQQNTPRQGAFIACLIDTTCCNGRTAPCRRVVVNVVDQAGVPLNGGSVGIKFDARGGASRSNKEAAGTCVTGPPFPNGQCQTCFGAQDGFVAGDFTAGPGAIGGSAADVRVTFPDRVIVENRCFGP